MPDLEGRIGELCGQLRSLLSTLERVERRQDETRDKVQTSEANIGNMQEQLSDIHNSMPGRFDDMEKIRRSLDQVQRDVLELKNHKRRGLEKAWDVIKILLAATIGAVLAKAIN